MNWINFTSRNLILCESVLRQELYSSTSEESSLVEPRGEEVSMTSSSRIRLDIIFNTANKLSSLKAEVQNSLLSLQLLNNFFSAHGDSAASWCCWQWSLVVVFSAAVVVVVVLVAADQTAIFLDSLNLLEPPLLLTTSKARARQRRKPEKKRRANLWSELKQPGELAKLLLRC